MPGEHMRLSAYFRVKGATANGRGLVVLRAFIAGGAFAVMAGAVLAALGLGQRNTGSLSADARVIDGCGFREWYFAEEGSTDPCLVFRCENQGKDLKVFLRFSKDAVVVKTEALLDAATLGLREAKDTRINAGGFAIAKFRLEEREIRLTNIRLGQEEERVIPCASTVYHAALDPFLVGLIDRRSLPEGLTLFVPFADRLVFSNLLFEKNDAGQLEYRTRTDMGEQSATCSLDRSNGIPDRVCTSLLLGKRVVFKRVGFMNLVPERV